MQELSAKRYARSVHHLPVGSNVPDKRDAREGVRRRLGVEGRDLVVAMFGSSHPSRLIDHLVRGICAISEDHDRVIALNLGAGAPRLPGVGPPVEVHNPRSPRGDLSPALLPRTCS